MLSPRPGTVPPVAPRHGMCCVSLRLVACLVERVAHRPRHAPQPRAPRAARRAALPLQLRPLREVLCRLRFVLRQTRQPVLIAEILARATLEIGSGIRSFRAAGTPAGKEQP